MPLLLGRPKNWIGLGKTIAAIQVWAGKVEGFGKWVDVPYALGIYSAAVGTWTVEVGDQLRHAYAIFNDTMLWKIRLIGTSTDSSVSNELYVKLPDGFKMDVDSGFQGVVSWNTSSDNGLGVVSGRAAPTDNMVTLLRDVASPSTDWPNPSTNDLNIAFNLVMRIRREV